MAKKNKLVTQMGTQIHAEDNYRRVVELLRAGAIGDVREVHVWLDKSYAPGDPPNRPNIVFFIADDMSIKDSSAYGETRIPGPNMTAFAREGLTFDLAAAAQLMPLQRRQRR